MSCPPEYWIWMQRTLGAGVNADSILMYFGNPQKLYESGKGQWISSGVIGTAAAKKLTSYSPSQSYDIIKTCRENGWSIIAFDDERYPESLKEIYCPPVVLYVWGDASVLREKVLISMVGTRNASEYGLSVAESLSYSLGEAGAVLDGFGHVPQVFVGRKRVHAGGEIRVMQGELTLGAEEKTALRCKPPHRGRKKTPMRAKTADRLMGSKHSPEGTSLRARNPRSIP